MRQTGRAPALLVAIIIAGAVLRLVRLDHPCLWGDEAWVYGRTCGSFTQMMDYMLHHDGFMPLLYIGDWWLGDHLGHSPAVLRLIPTLCGIAMIPAMYGLTMRFLADRGTALWVAALTACSTFLVCYSRDAKPYMPLWCLEAMSVGALLGWLDTRRWGYWIYWVAASAMMVGVHGLGLIVLGLQIVLLVNRCKPAGSAATTRPSSSRAVTGFLLGLAIVLAGPAVYYLAANHWITNIRRDGWQASGLDWIGDWISGHGPAALSLNSLCIFLDGWGWIDRGKLPRWIAWAEYLVFAGFLAALALALIPRRRSTPNPDAQAICRLWRAVLWIGASLLVPPFITYCTIAARPSCGWMLWCAVAGLVWMWRRRRADLFPSGLDLGAPACTAAALLGVCLASWTYCATHRVNPLWVARYLGIAWPALAIGACALLGRLPALPLRIGALSLLLAVNAGHTLANQLLDVEIRRDRLAADVVSAQQQGSGVRVYAGDNVLETRDADGSYQANPVTRYYLLLLTPDKRLTPDEFRHGRLDDWFSYRHTHDPAAIAADVASTPLLHRLVVWEILPQNVPVREPAEMLGRLGRGWVCQEQEILVEHAQWGLGTVHRTQRSVYVKRDANP